MKRFVAVIICAGMAFGAGAQLAGDKHYAEVMVDSVLTYEEYLGLVEAYHPVSIVAQLEVEFAEGKLRASRGGFDPALYGNYNTKDFKNEIYYNELNAGIEIPTWMGLSLQAGFTNNSGVFLNPEQSTPGPGLVNAGVTAQLGAGLLMDSRRAALRQAQIGLDQGILKRTLLLNKLYFEATKAYYNWAFAERALHIAEDALELANFRYEAVRQGFKYGDVPAIDTVEAYTQVLNRLYKLRGAQTDWVAAVNVVGVYLWDDAYSARLVPPGVNPDSLANDAVPTDHLPLQIDAGHPELRSLRNDLAIVDIDRRLAAEYLRPKVELKYNFLSENVQNASGEQWFGNTVFFEDDFDFGAKVYFPLFLREARGKLNMAKIEMRMIDQDYFNLEASLKASLDAALVELNNLREQVDFLEQNVEFLSRLLEGERQLFENGESSLFLINARETQLVDGQNIYYENIAKQRILVSEIRVIAGEGF